MLTRIWTVLLVVVALLASACTANAGSAFAEQYRAFLDSVPEVESHQVTGNNNLPGSGSADSDVTLKADVDARRVAEVFTKLVNHRVDQKVSEHHLSVRFTTVNGSGDDAVVSVYETITRDSKRLSVVAARETVDRVVAFAAQDPGLAEFSTSVNTVQVTTADDPFGTADRVLAFLAADPSGVRNVMINSGPGFVSLFADGSVEPLRPIATVLAALPEDVEPIRWRANAQNPEREPVFEIALPRGTDAGVVSELERVAEDVGISVKVTVAV